uniref:Reverse transcriptase Ty1/copia-type domain-containing protein n=1 Tax=Amphimedon queenslandica TaxID=400682 RepID=A0A1X7TLL9_AMPQE
MACSLEKNRVESPYKDTVYWFIFAAVTRIKIAKFYISIAKWYSLQRIYEDLFYKILETASDVKTDFLNGELKETVDMKQKEGYGEKGKENLVIKCSIHGLKQSSHYWNYILDSQLKNMPFAQSNSDP